MSDIFSKMIFLFLYTVYDAIASFDVEILDIAKKKKSPEQTSE
jgi:hypothetical protein